MGQILSTALDALHRRNAATLHAAQAAWEQPPELPADDELLPHEAHGRAVDELLTTAEPLADWIAKACACDAGRAPIDTLGVTALQLLDTDSIPLLLACILAGDSQQADRAARRLRDLYVGSEKKAIEARAAALMRGEA